MRNRFESELSGIADVGLRQALQQLIETYEDQAAARRAAKREEQLELAVQTAQQREEW